MSKVSEHGNELRVNEKTFFFDEREKQNTKQYWFAIRELTGRELKRKYARSYLGVVWSVLSPLFNMIVLSLIFSYMFRRNIENFPVYYLIGGTIWTLFRTATDSAMTALVDNKQLLIRAKLPKYTFILSRIYTALIIYLYSIIPLIAIIVFFGIHITVKALLIIPVLALVTLFSTGIGFILSIVYVFFADIKYLYSILLTAWMYLSALFYPVSVMPDFMQEVIGYNPIFLAIDISRTVLQYGELPPILEWIKLFIFAVVFLFFGILIFLKSENHVMTKV